MTKIKKPRLTSDELSEIIQDCMNHLEKFDIDCLCDRIDDIDANKVIKISKILGIDIPQH